MSIRRAVAADAGAIASISVRGWQTAYRGLIPDAYLDALSLEERTAAWREYLERGLNGFRMWVLEEDGRVCGFTRSGPSADADCTPQTGQVFGLYVDPELIGSGVGRALFRHALSDLRARGFREATVWVFEGNQRAERFYRAAGCRLDGKRRLDPSRGYEAPEERFRIALARGPVG